MHVSSVSVCKTPPQQVEKVKSSIFAFLIVGFAETAGKELIKLQKCEMILKFLHLPLEAHCAPLIDGSCGIKTETLSCKYQLRLLFQSSSSVIVPLCHLVLIFHMQLIH